MRILIPHVIPKYISSHIAANMFNSDSCSMFPAHSLFQFQNNLYYFTMKSGPFCLPSPHFVSLPPFSMVKGNQQVFCFVFFFHWLTYIQLELFCESSIFLNSRVKYLCIEVKYTLQLFIFVTFMQHILSKFCTLKYQFLYPSFKTVKNMRTNGK